MPAGASKVSQNATGDVANCRAQEVCALAGADSLAQVIRPTVDIVQILRFILGSVLEEGT